jgi:hypothetical protein
MARVFVVQDPSDKNILPATHYGDIHIMLFKKDVDRGLDHCVTVLRDRLMDITDDDSLLPIGDPILIGLATHIAMHFGEGSINMLRWQRESYRYTQEHITI